MIELINLILYFTASSFCIREETIENNIVRYNVVTMRNITLTGNDKNEKENKAVSSTTFSLLIIDVHWSSGYS